MIEIKNQLLEYCKNHILQRHSKIKQTISNIEESLLEESKNSSGDKHETGRAMLQINRENAGKQLLEIEKLISIFSKINITLKSDYARLGSLIYTEKYIYFISLPIGSIKLNNKEFLCIGLSSPIGAVLLGKKSGETFEYNNQKQKILFVK